MAEREYKLKITADAKQFGAETREVINKLNEALPSGVGGAFGKLGAHSARPSARSRHWPAPSLAFTNSQSARPPRSRKSLPAPNFPRHRRKPSRLQLAKKESSRKPCFPSLRSSSKSRENSPTGTRRLRGRLKSSGFRKRRL